jgi:hypothetical protein
LTHNFKRPPVSAKPIPIQQKKPMLSWRGIAGMKLPPYLHARKMAIKTGNMKWSVPIFALTIHAAREVG